MRLTDHLPYFLFLALAVALQRGCPPAPNPAPVLPPAPHRPAPTPVLPAPPKVVPPPVTPTPGVAAPGLGSLNEFRASLALKPLSQSPLLTATAQAWADAMARSGTLGHGDFVGRMEKAGVTFAVAENVAEGFPDAASVVKAWANDPPHRLNMSNPAYRQAGLAAAKSADGKMWWCLDLAN